jgi:predicted DNA-binding transcriptional regulator YafY
MANTLLIDGDHLMRLMKLCRMIDGSKGLSVPQLQTRLQTSRRTIFRDLKDLEAAGIKVALGIRGYHLDGTLAQCRKRLVDSQTKALHDLLQVCLR